MFKDYAKELTAIFEELKQEVVNRELELNEMAETAERDEHGEFVSGAVEDLYAQVNHEMEVFDDACGWLENAIQVLMEG